MRKSNIFLLAYVIFLFTAGIAWSHIQNNFISNRILLCVTISSSFFAIADFLYVISENNVKTYKNSLKKAKCTVEFIDEIVRDSKLQYSKIYKSLLFLEKINNFSIEQNNTNLFSKSNKIYVELNKLYIDEDSNINYLTGYKENFLKSLKKIESKKVRLPVFLNLAKFFLFLGFFSFFSFLIFEVFTDQLLPKQESITLIAFGIVVLNYYLKDIFLTREEREHQYFKELIEDYKSIKFNFDKISLKYNEIMGLIHDLEIEFNAINNFV